MLSEKEIQSLKEGAYGITRDGKKTKYIGRTQYGNYIWAYLAKDDMDLAKDDIDLAKDDIVMDWYKGYDNFACYDQSRESEKDIVGLWEDKPEPFDLERALAGEPVLIQSGRKAYVKYKVDVDDSAQVNKYLVLQGYLEKENGTFGYILNWNINGKFNDTSSNDNHIIGMWKEPVPEPVSTELPKPITEFGDLTQVYRLGFSEDAPYFVFTSYKNNEWNQLQQATLEAWLYFASREDVIKVIEAITGKPYKE